MIDIKTTWKPLDVNRGRHFEPSVKRTDAAGMVALAESWGEKMRIGDMARQTYGNDAHKAMDKVREALRSRGHYGSVMLWESSATAEDVADLIGQVFGK